MWMIQKRYLLKNNSVIKSKKPWKVVMGHHTWRSIAGHGNAEPRLETFLTDLLTEAPFDIYTCGHDHNKQLITMEIMNNTLPLIVCGF